MENFGANFGENDNLLSGLWTKEKVKEIYIWTTDRHTVGKLPYLNNYTLKKRKMEKQSYTLHCPQCNYLEFCGCNRKFYI